MSFAHKIKRGIGEILRYFPAKVSVKTPVLYGEMLKGRTALITGGTGGIGLEISRAFLRNGADKVVYPEKQVANWAAIRYSSDHILDYVSLDDKYSIYEVSVPESWVGKTILQLDVRKKHNLTIIGIKTTENLDFVIQPDTVLTSDNTLLVLGDYKSIQKCF